MTPASKKNSPKPELERKSGVRHSIPDMLPIVPNQKHIPTALIEEAISHLLRARREVAGIFADDQPSLFPELDEEHKIPLEKAEAIIRRAEELMDAEKNIGFKMENGQVKIIPVYRSNDVWTDIGYQAK